MLSRAYGTAIAAVPFIFRIQVSHRTQEPPFSSSWMNRGYNRAPHHASEFATSSPVGSFKSWISSSPRLSPSLRARSATRSRTAGTASPHGRSKIENLAA